MATSKFLITLALVLLTIKLSKGFKCYKCVNCAEPPKASQPCDHRLGTKTCFITVQFIGGIKNVTRGCSGIRNKDPDIPSCSAIQSSLSRKSQTCICNGDSCNAQRNPNFNLTKTESTEDKLAPLCYLCANCPADQTKFQCSEGFEGCLKVTEVSGKKKVTKKICAVGYESGCKSLGTTTTCYCEGDLCNGNDKSHLNLVLLVLVTVLKATIFALFGI